MQATTRTPEFYGQVNIQAGIVAAQEEIYIAKFLQIRVQLGCPADVSVARGLYGVKYFHKLKLLG